MQIRQEGGMNQKSTQMRRATRGANLTETTIVLGIIGILLGGIWAMIGDMRNSVKQQKFAELLTTVVDNIRGNYTGKAFFETTQISTGGGVTGMMPRLKDMNVFPGEMVQTGVDGIASPFGANTFFVCGWRSTGSTACNLAAGGTSNVPFFAIETRFANTGDCVQAVSRNSNPRTQPGLVDVYINGTGRVSAIPSLSLPWPPLASLTLAACARVAKPVTVDFVYRLTP